MNKNASRRRNVQGSPYKINGQRCYDHAGQPCKLYSRARDVVRLARESGEDLVSYFFSLFFLLGFYDKVTCLSLLLLIVNDDADCSRRGFGLRIRAEDVGRVFKRNHARQN